jgi:hypothetical protein
VFDSPWETAYNDFTFNMTQFGADATIEGTHYAGFASAAEMFEFLRANGLKAICWMAPLLNVSSDDEHTPGQIRALLASMWSVSCDPECV